MSWSPFTIAALGCAVWAALCGLFAWGISRWFRWVRGDFDRSE